MKNTHVPCWLTDAQLEQAQFLCSLGFEYCGKAGDWDVFDGFIHDDPTYKVGSWAFYLDEDDSDLPVWATCENAIYERAATAASLPNQYLYKLFKITEGYLVNPDIYLKLLKVEKEVQDFKNFCTQQSSE